LLVHARELLDDADRFDATKAGITVGQEQRPSIYAVLLAGPISPMQEWIAVVGAQTAYIERGSPWENGYIGKPPRGASEAS
jgi:hypothetical protein